MMNENEKREAILPCDNCIHEKVCMDYGTKENCKEYAEPVQWVSVNERLPEAEGRYLTCDHKGNIHIFSHYAGFQQPFGISERDKRFYMVTHWAPLPEPAKREETCNP